jgi:hypothetical protein
MNGGGYLVPHPYKTSKIAQLIDRQLEAAIVADTDLGLSPCQTANAACVLAPGIEHLFVTKTANYLVARLNKELDASWLFQELVYCPHQTSEKKCGFDLSVGHYQRPNRIRTMHKLHFGTKQVHPWPDEDWTWSTLDGNAKERDRIKRHLLLLLDVYKERGFYEPFLALHLCFCVHEYRRMREDEPGHLIPSFVDPLRTVIVDLRPLARLVEYKPVINAEHFGILIQHNHAACTTDARLLGVPRHDTLPVLTMEELGDRAVERVSITF